MLVKLVLGGFSDLMYWNNYNLNWKKKLGFKNLQEKLKRMFVCVNALPS